MKAVKEIYCLHFVQSLFGKTILSAVLRSFTTALDSKITNVSVACCFRFDTLPAYLAAQQLLVLRYIQLLFYPLSIRLDINESSSVRQM